MRGGLKRPSGSQWVSVQSPLMRGRIARKIVVYSLTIDVAPYAGAWIEQRLAIGQRKTKRRPYAGVD